MAIAVFAVFRAGGIACPINTRLNPRELADYAALCEPRFCLTDAPALVKTLELAGRCHVAATPRDPSALPEPASPDPHADAKIPGTSGTHGQAQGHHVSHPHLMTGYPHQNTTP